MYYHDDPVYGLNIHPEDNNVFLTASDDGKVMLWDIRTSPVSGKVPVYIVLYLYHCQILLMIDCKQTESPQQQIRIVITNTLKTFQEV